MELLPTVTAVIEAIFSIFAGVLTLGWGACLPRRMVGLCGLFVVTLACPMVTLAQDDGLTDAPRTALSAQTVYDTLFSNVPQYDVASLDGDVSLQFLTWFDPAASATLYTLPTLDAWHPRGAHQVTANSGREWIALALTNSQDSIGRAVLSFDEAFLEEADFYQIAANGDVQHFRNGIQIPISVREIGTRMPAQAFTVTPESPVLVLVSLRSRFEADVSLLLQPPNLYAEWIVWQSSSYTFFFGGALAIILFNLFLFWSIREKLYLFYTLHGLCVIGFVLRYSGFSLYVIEEPAFHYKLAVISWLQVVFLMEFTRRLLDVKTTAPQLNTLLKVGMGLFGLLAVATWFDISFYSVGIRLSFLTVILLFGIGIYSAIQRNPMGIFYVIAETPYLLGYVLLAGLSAGVVQYSFWSRYGFMVGSLFELVTFSMALGYRFRQSEQRRFVAQTQLMELQDSVNQELSQKVAARTGELERATAQLRSLTADYANLLQSISVGVVSTDVNDHITFRNASFSRLTQDIPALEQKLVARVASAEHHDIDEIVIEDNRGKKHHLLINACHRRSEEDEDAGHWVVITDVTELRANEASLNHAAKMATLGEMSTGMAHELNQPLNVIRLSLENINRALQKDPIDHVKLKSRITRIDTQVERAAKLIAHMRTFGRIAPSEFEPFDIGQAIRSAIDLLAEQLRLDQVEVQLELPEMACWSNGSGSQFEQVMLNLLTNARDAIKERQPSVRRIDVRLSSHGDKHQIAVEDTGGGLSPEVKDRIFEPFFTTKKLSEGTGLGGSISYGIITDMGGVIAVDNTDQGALFTIQLPILAESAQP